MIFAKCFAIAWMLGWFFILFKAVVKEFIGGHGDIFSFVMTLALTWFLLGFLPILIVKFGWDFIK